jgi:hypothetical protein
MGQVKVAAMVMTAVAMIQRFLMPRGSGGDAGPSSSSPAAAGGGSGQTPGDVDKERQKALLASHIEQRQNLKHTAKLAAISITVLLVLNIEATPVVVADLHLQDQYGDQVRALVEVEGLVARLGEVVSGGAPVWEQRVGEQVETAMRRIDEFDAYDQLLASAETSPPDQPEFLRACQSRDPAVEPLIQTSTALRSTWRFIVERCIIERMGPEFDGDGRDGLSEPLEAAHADVTAAITQARREFPQAPPVDQVEPVESVAWQAFDGIERSIGQLVRIIQTGPEAAIAPPPAEWLTQFTGGDGTLRSFRDNLLLTYAGPYAGTTRTDRSDVDAKLSVLPLAVSVDGAHGLKTALDTVRDSQIALQKDIEDQAADLDSAVPDLFKPVLVVAKPTYLVLLFPLVVALVGGYLLLVYTRLERNAQALRAAGASDLPPQSLLFFLALALVPLGLLVGLLPTYDWPQFVHSWWQWSHRGPLLLFTVVALWCALGVIEIVTTDGRRRAISAQGATAAQDRPEPAPNPRPSGTQDAGLGQPNLGPGDA